ncbi:hypothetical protein P7C70_g3099, partial [Phenoliferia sp. Uapishka_3]
MTQPAADTLNPPLCAVCPAPGSLRCSRCKHMFFCDAAHQTLVRPDPLPLSAYTDADNARCQLWPTHKHMCKANEPLLYTAREPTKEEMTFFLDFMREHPGIKEVSSSIRIGYWLLRKNHDNVPSVNLSNADHQRRNHLISVILHKALGMNDETAYARVDPFRIVSRVLIGKNEIIERLRPEVRNAFELQLLVLCAVLKDAHARSSFELLEIAFARLRKIVEGENALQDLVALLESEWLAGRGNDM